MKNLLKRLWMSFLIRSEEIHLDDLLRTIREVNSSRAYVFIAMEIDVSRQELAKMRSEYNALLPIGQRKTWKVA